MASFIPTEAGFVNFLRTIVGITTAVLPDNSPVIDYVYELACATVNEALRCAAGPIYQDAMYNLATSLLYRYAPDVQPPVVYANKLSYFAYYRNLWSINAPSTGVITATADESTSASFQPIEAAKNFTLANLQQMKDPWGQNYLAIAQDYGSLWGLT